MIDIDSFVGEVHGEQKQGAGYGYTRQLGYHPIAAVRADTGEVLHIRNRKGKANTQRGAGRFIDELLARVRRAGHTGPIIIRADSGFENHKLMAALARRGVEFSIGVKQSQTIRALIERDPRGRLGHDRRLPRQRAGADRRNPARELAADRAPHPSGRRPSRVVARLAPPLLRDQPHRAALTADIDHRDHATIELVIRDLKDQALAHFPSGQMHANSAWTVIAALAHNLGRWSTLIGLPDQPVQTARARRRHLLQIPARLTRTSRQWTLRMPARWPWQPEFITVLDLIRALPARA